MKCLRIIVNANNNGSEEIKGRIRTGYRTYWRYQKLLRDRNINRRTKLKIYDVAIKPAVTNAEETM